MKKITMLLALLVILSGCGEVEKDDVSTNKAIQSFIIVNNKDDNFVEYKHIKTGCHYVDSTFNADYLTQMFIEKNGVSVPFCD
jgi:hypothetical protein